LLAVAFLVFLSAAYIVLVIYMSRSSCVVLPNGYLLGHEATFARAIVSQMTMIGPMTLRQPNGEVLVKGRRDVELLRDPENPRGIVMDYSEGRLKMSGDVMMPLIWNKQFRGHEWHEPTPGFPDDMSIIHTSFFHVYNELSKSEKFEKVGCETPWFDWGE